MATLVPSFHTAGQQPLETPKHAGRMTGGPLMVPLDGQVAADVALPVALGLARRLNAELLLVGIATPVTALAPRSAPVPVDADGGAERAACLKLRRGAEAARLAGVRTRELLVAAPGDAPAAPAIVAAVAELHPSLVVMAPPGSPGVERRPAALRGALAVAAGGTPVLVLSSPGAPGAPIAPHAPDQASPGSLATLLDPAAAACRLLVALSGRRGAEVALDVAAALAVSLPAELSLVRVTQSGIGHLGAMSAVDEAGIYLQGAARGLHGRGIDPGVVRLAIRVGQVADTLLAQAAREHAAALVLAPHAGRLTDPLPPNSITGAVLTRAPLPVLLVPSH